MAISLGILTQHFQTNPPGERVSIPQGTGQHRQRKAPTRRAAGETRCGAALQRTAGRAPGGRRQVIAVADAVAGGEGMGRQRRRDAGTAGTAGT